MQNMKEFIARNNLLMSAKRAKTNPSMDSKQPMDHWVCNITIKNHDTWPVSFSMGHGHNGKAPELADVLDCLASDAAGYENAQDFEDWASEYGYDTDSRKAEATYNTVNDQINEMRGFLGDDTYQELLWETERE